MSRRMFFLLLIAFFAAACTGGADTPTTTTTTTLESTTTTGRPTTTTSPEVTNGAEASTTTEFTTTTAAGPVVTVIDIVLAGGTVERVERFDVPLDGKVRLVVTAGVSDEIHVHGYDLHADVTPETDGVLEFDATIPGVFEIELEGSGMLIGELQVAP